MKILWILLALLIPLDASGGGLASNTSDPVGFSGFATRGGIAGSVQRGPWAARPPRWELTNTDPEMYALAQRLGVGRGGRDCGTGMWMYRYGFRADGKRFVAGGNRLARYLVGQYELARKVGAVNARTLLYYAAYTESDAIVDFLADEIDRLSAKRDASTLPELLRVVAVSARPEVVEDLLYVLERWTDTTVPERVKARTAAIHALREVIDYTEVDRPDVVALLREIEWDQVERSETRKAAWHALNRWEIYQLTDRRDASPSEFGERRGYRRKMIEKSREAEAFVLRQHDGGFLLRAEWRGRVREFMHCGLAEWAIRD